MSRMVYHFLQDSDQIESDALQKQENEIHHFKTITKFTIYLACMLSSITKQNIIPHLWLIKC